MDREALLADVRNDRIQFVTTRPPGSKFAVLERRVSVTGPPTLVELAQAGDAQVLDDLAALLNDPSRAWAAAVLLAALTGHEAKVIDAYAARPEAWWAALGPTAQARWAAWLDEHRASLTWDAQAGTFVAAN